MDCGPAVLNSLLDGFGIHASYGRLREACRTAVDGTSIDTLEELAQEAGLEAQQVMLPLDHVLLPASRTFPSIAVVRNASGGAHFVLAWRRVGGFVQVMDPARGRVWIHTRSFLNQLVLHTMRVPAEWAEFRDPMAASPVATSSLTSGSPAPARATATTSDG